MKDHTKTPVRCTLSFLWHFRFICMYFQSIAILAIFPHHLNVFPIHHLPWPNILSSLLFDTTIRIKCLRFECHDLRYGWNYLFQKLRDTMPDRWNKCHLLLGSMQCNSVVLCSSFNRPRQKGWYFTDGIFKRSLLIEDICISTFSLKFNHDCWIDNKGVLVLDIGLVPNRRRAIIWAKC